MNNKKYYIWQLSSFLASHNMKMSGEELTEHLHRNNFLRNYEQPTNVNEASTSLIKETWKWAQEDLNLSDEAKK